MLSTMRNLPRNIKPLHRTLATATQTRTRGPRPEGDISSVFASLSGDEPVPLPARFADTKTSLINGKKQAIISSWTRLLSSLRTAVDEIAAHGSSIIPTLSFSDITNLSLVEPFSKSLKRHGVAIIRDVVPQSEALKWKQEIKAYITANPQTKAFPKDKPAVYELYWSPGQIKARAHPNVIATQKFLMGSWHCTQEKDALISTNYPVAYADRLRIRQPGDSGFALGPHVDGGSAERWENNGYGLGKVYDKVLEGKWEEFDPWESSGRLKAESDLYNGAGACSMFRMFQGWLGMSNTRAWEGTLLVNPLFKLATAYYLLRPFFRARNEEAGRSGFLDAENWVLDSVQSTVLQGATLGKTLELKNALHPHLELSKSMVHIPDVKPGDYVAWHCDSIHAVDSVHAGKGDSSVLYIPACPLTEANARYLVRQREAFLEGTPGPDFPGGKGESEHVGRMTEKDIQGAGSEEALRAMGLSSWEATSDRDMELIRIVNDIVS